MTSPVPEPEAKIVQEAFLGDHQDIASSSGMTLEPLTSRPVDTIGLVMVLLLSMIVLQLTAKVADIEDVSFGPIIGLNKRLVQLIVYQFFTYIDTFLPVMLQDLEAFEGIMMELKGQVCSIRCFDDAFTNKLIQLIDRLRV